ncbi:MAG: hypothetical protein ABSF29_12620 [Tepidisphaeraceae bacterium]|jgi:hypothetical protein
MKIRNSNPEARNGGGEMVRPIDILQAFLVCFLVVAIAYVAFIGI